MINGISWKLVTPISDTDLCVSVAYYNFPETQENGLGFFASNCYRALNSCRTFQVETCSRHLTKSGLKVFPEFLPASRT
jgi:hypothetical protein